jgi:DDE superfamily endonuclease/Archaeal putative transposase ISC1217
MHLPDPIIAIFLHFQPLLSARSYRKMVLLVCGTIMAKGRRTVTTALKVLGLEQQTNWTKYHNLLNRAKWRGLLASALLLKLLVCMFVASNAPFEIAVDETLERRWGRKIAKKGHWRDSAASSHGLNVTSCGLKWLTFALIVKLPWAKRRWALPFLAVLITTPKVSKELGLAHHTVTKRTGQIIKWLAKQFPKREIKLIGDGTYSVINLGLLCQKKQIALIAPIRLDARLFAPPPPRKAPARGRPRVVGVRLPNLSELALDFKQEWQTVEVACYSGKTKTMALLSGTALWYSTLWGERPLPLRWVLVRDPQGRLATKAYFCSDANQTAEQIVTAFVGRWSIEVIFEEVRAHLGVETQRQWNDLAIERTTPVLLGLFSLVCLFGNALQPDGKFELYQTAWYPKTEATFSDILAAVRRALWGYFNFQTSPDKPDVCLIPRAVLDRLAFAACY